MKKILIKTAMAGMLCMGFVSCADELNIKSVDPHNYPTYSCLLYTSDAADDEHLV